MNSIFIFIYANIYLIFNNGNIIQLKKVSENFLQYNDAIKKALIRLKYRIKEPNKHLRIYKLPITKKLNIINHV